MLDLRLRSAAAVKSFVGRAEPKPILHNFQHTSTMNRQQIRIDKYHNEDNQSSQIGGNSDD